MNKSTIKKYIIELVDKIDDYNLLIVILNFVQKCYFK